MHYTQKMAAFGRINVIKNINENINDITDVVDINVNINENNEMNW
jgi:hypothetical protein